VPVLPLVLAPAPVVSVAAGVLVVELVALSAEDELLVLFLLPQEAAVNNTDKKRMLILICFMKFFLKVEQ
jgi:hypothetical protein